jgi:hypothetical protein
MKYTITVETEDEFERIAIINAVKNKLLLDGIYDDVFRPIIKYSDDEKQVEAFGIVWDKLSEYLDDN